MKRTGFAAAFAAFAVLTTLIWGGAYLYFKAQELDKAQARLTLYSASLQAALQNFAHLPFLLSLDPMVIETLGGGPPAPLSKRLARMAQSAGVDAIYVMDPQGVTRAASNAQTPRSFVGQNYSYRPYFQAALRGELGEFYGIGATTGVPGYFYAMAVRKSGQVIGVIAIKLNLGGLQDSWQASKEQIMLSNADGVVLLASNPDWRYHLIKPLPAEKRADLATHRQFADEPLRALNWAPNPGRQTAVIDAQGYLYVRTGDLPHSWVLHFFVPKEGATTRAGLAAGVFVLLAGALLLAAQMRRGRQIGLDLQRSEHEESQLRAANARLAVEIEERRAAEHTLQATQKELERAGRLAALGQLASSVTHELGQPIAAMRNQLAAAEIAQGETPLGRKMQALVARMEDITRQLKFFSRKGRDQFEQVDLVDVIQSALDLLAPNIAAAGAQLSVQMPRVGAALMQGNRLRLEQVITNLVRNALDALEGASLRQVTITLQVGPDHLCVDIADTGHGLGGQSLEDLREPFATTRESGKGMGLGLTISAGIVSDHGGVLTAKDTKDGAVFRAQFPALPLSAPQESAPA